ncbi:hypothetical protein COOONC_00924 [Cooperia oncophora]
MAIVHHSILILQTPIYRYWKQWPKGELTSIGMQQHYTQGVKLRQRYSGTYGLINKTFTREEVCQSWEAFTLRFLDRVTATEHRHSGPLQLSRAVFRCDSAEELS